MADIEWKPLPAGLWTLPAVFMEAGNLLLEAFMEAGVPTWKVSEKTNDPLKWNLIAKGTADSFELKQRLSTKRKQRHRNRRRAIKL